MEPKNRLMIVAAVTVLMLGAMGTSFGRSLFALHTPEVVLPSQTAQLGPDPVPDINGTDQVARVELTCDTVQAVVETLSRTESYYRELTVETFWGEHSSLTQIKVWTDGGWSHSRQVLPSGAIRHDLVGEDTHYYWYDGSKQYLSTPADPASADLSQHIPTYETVLALPLRQITEASYTLLEDHPCVYAAFADPDLELVTRFWVSMDSGLLMAAEQETQGALVYRMTALGSVQSPCPPDAPFTLPDGSQLHEL